MLLNGLLPNCRILKNIATFVFAKQIRIWKVTNMSPGGITNKPMKASHKISILALWLVGLCLLAAGVCGFCSLADAADEYLCTTGTVEEVAHKHVYKYRKRRTEFDVSIRYSTTLYGDMYASLDYYVPFLLDEGDKVRVLYNPRLPREFRLPGPESLLYGSLLGLGTLLLGGGAAVCARRRRRADVRNEG